MPQNRKIAQNGELNPYGALPAPKVTPELIRLVRTGTVYSLSVVFSEKLPAPGPLLPYTLSPGIRHGDWRELAPASVAGETISMSTHTGTHIDALCHIGEHQNTSGHPDVSGSVQLFAGHGQTVSADKTASMRGQTHLSIAHMPPIVTRGVLLDVARFKDLDVLPDAYAITAEDIAGTLDKEGVQIESGSAVLVRTGFYQHLRDGNPAYTEAIAGLNLEAAKFLVEQGMVLAGADNMTVEALPPLDHSVHRFLLVHNGITHLENLYLDDIARQRVYEFLLIVSPLRLQGATGSWVNPIAIA
jgi:kynurenine formamidase